MDVERRLGVAGDIVMVDVDCRRRLRVCDVRFFPAFWVVQAKLLCAFFLRFGMQPRRDAESGWMLVKRRTVRFKLICCPFLLLDILSSDIDVAISRQQQEIFLDVLERGM